MSFVKTLLLSTGVLLSLSCSAFAGWNFSSSETPVVQRCDAVFTNVNGDQWGFHWNDTDGQYTFQRQWTARSSKGQNIRYGFSFDGKPEFSMNLVYVTPNISAAGIPDSAIGSVLKQFKTHHSISLYTIIGKQWENTFYTISLNGSSVVLDKFQKCVKKAIENTEEGPNEQE